MKICHLDHSNSTDKKDFKKRKKEKEKREKTFRQLNITKVKGELKERDWTGRVEIRTRKKFLAAAGHAWLYILTCSMIDLLYEHLLISR